LDADHNEIYIDAHQGDVTVFAGLAIINDVTAFDGQTATVQMSDNVISVSAFGTIDLVTGAGLFVTGHSTLDLTMTDNHITLHGMDVTAGDLYNVDVYGTLATGSTVGGNSIDVSADGTAGEIHLGTIHLNGDDASAHVWGNDVYVGTLLEATLAESHVTFGAEHLDVMAGSNGAHIDLIDLTKPAVALSTGSTSTNWWTADAYISADTTLNIDDIKLDGAQGFLHFDISDTMPTIHYDVTISDFGIAANNGLLGYGTLQDSGLLTWGDVSLGHVAHGDAGAQQFDLIDLSALGITSESQLVVDAITLGSAFNTLTGGLVDEIKFHIATTGTDELATGSTAVFELHDIRLNSSAAHDYQGTSHNTAQGNTPMTDVVGSVDEHDVWYAFWNYSLHLAPGLVPG